MEKIKKGSGTTDLTVGRPLPQILKFALPLVLGFYPGMRDNFAAAAGRLKFDGMVSVQLIFGEHAVGFAAIERAEKTLNQNGAHHITGFCKACEEIQFTG